MAVYLHVTLIVYLSEIETERERERNKTNVIFATTKTNWKRYKIYKNNFEKKLKIIVLLSHTKIPADRQKLEKRNRIYSEKAFEKKNRKIKSTCNRENLRVISTFFKNIIFSSFILILIIFKHFLCCFLISDKIFHFLKFISLIR